MFKNRSQQNRPGLIVALSKFLGESAAALSLRLKLIGCFGSICAVLFLCRGLLFGTGGYQLYVDSALPASGILLRGVCSNSLTLWSSVNLGQRVLYPSEYLVCGGIAGLLSAGVPAWAISRLLPIAAMCIGASGMVLLLENLQLWRRLGAPLPKPAVLLTIWAGGVVYACSALSFNELVTGHFLYLVALALFPWSALVLYSWKPSVAAVALGGALLSLSYVQVQFVVLAPICLLLVALLATSARMAWRSVAASAIGIIPHLPWIIPLLAYPPRINLATYLQSVSDANYSVSPADSLRLVGYVVPFVGVTVQDWYTLWRTLSFEALALTLIGIGSLLWKRAIGLLALLAVILLYQWGINSPGYGLWSHIVPWPFEALFRERYGLSFVTLVIVVILSYLVLLESFRIRPQLGAFVLIAVVAGWIAPFADGHLGPFGTVRERFDTAAALTTYIDGHEKGSVLTIPFGSIVRGSTWAYFGRSPFSMGGPPGVLDTEGSPTAPELPLVHTLADSLSGTSASNLQTANEYMQLLHVRYVVEWLDLRGDVPVELVNVRANLLRLGAHRAWQNREAILWIDASLPTVSSVEFQESTGDPLLVLDKSGHVIYLPDKLFRELLGWLLIVTVAATLGCLAWLAGLVVVRRQRSLGARRDSSLLDGNIPGRGTRSLSAKALDRDDPGNTD